MSDGNNPALLDRVATGIHTLQGMEESSAPRPAQFRPAGHAAWAGQQFDADSPAPASDRGHESALSRASDC